jgi:hypothetical protein
MKISQQQRGDAYLASTTSKNFFFCWNTDEKYITKDSDYVEK